MLAALSKLVHIPCSAMSMSSLATEKRVEHLTTEIRLRHLQQLQHVHVSGKGPWNGTAASRLPSYFQYMQQWSAKARDQIHAAIAASAYAVLISRSLSGRLMLAARRDQRVRSMILFPTHS